ncbi:MAG: RidA family protein [Propionibacteriales bacterium]|nr:RidA family protein [Propionibacteriales bacterium]
MFTGLNPRRAQTSPFHSAGMLVTHIHQLATVSGQVGVRPDGTVGQGIVEQTQIAFENVEAVLAEGRLDLGAVIQYTIHLTDRAHIADFVRAGSPFLPEPRPACTLLIQAGLASPDLLVQIEALAAI